MDWSYLDRMDKNFLYVYANSIINNGAKYHYMKYPSVKEYEGRADYDELIKSEKRKAAWYILWFVFRYVLECETLEDAFKRANKETLKAFKLNSLFEHGYIYIGLLDDDLTVYFYKMEEIEIKIVLEIIYKRYDFFEQIECYIRQTENTNKGRNRSRCKKILAFAKKMTEEFKNRETNTKIERLEKI